MGGHDTGWTLAGLALAWLAGVALQLQERSLDPAALYLACAATGLAALATAWRWERLALLALPGIAAVAFGVAGWRAQERLAHDLPRALEGRDIEVVGLVATMPQRSVDGVRFVFEVESARIAGQTVDVPSLVSLGWYGGTHEEAVTLQPQHELRAGQRWRLVVRLRHPHARMNPHGFDAELALFEQGIGATGSVRDAPPHLLDRAAGYAVERLRQRLRDAIDATVGDRRSAGVLAALSLGDQSAIEGKDWDLFRDTGIAHLMSISGLHITMFAWLAGGLIGALWPRHARLALALPAPLAARWGGLAAAGAYAVFSGWGVPSQRTVCMLAAVVLLQSLGRRWPWPLLLLGAAAVVTALDPWAMLQAGFWLSFVAVGMLYASDVVHGRDGPAGSPEAATGGAARMAAIARHLRQGLRSQLVATLGLTPLTLLFFQQVSLVGFLANLVAIPLVTLVITPLALLGAVASPLWWAGAWAVQRLVALLAWLAGWPLAVWSVPVAPPWAGLCALLGAALLVMPLPWRMRLLGPLMALPMLWPTVARPPPGAFELLAADVGQGTAVLVRTRAHLLVFDAGPQYSLDSDAGRRVLLPLLRARGDLPVDVLMLSHRDSDHVGGAAALLQSGGVGALTSSIEPGHPLRALAAHHGRCQRGQHWDWDGVHFEVLQPPLSSYEAAHKSNAMSCVLRVSAGDASALLTGDIEIDQEAWLVATQAHALRTQVLVVPHHGSKTSSSAAFLDAVHPRIAVFQAGYLNRFGHPAPEVMARYVQRGIDVVESPACGAWIWRSHERGKGLCQRDFARRYWHHVLS